MQELRDSSCAAAGDHLPLSASVSELRFESSPDDSVHSASLESWLQRLRLSPNLRVLHMPRCWHAPMPFDLPDTLTELRMPASSARTEHYPTHWPPQLCVLQCSSVAPLSKLSALPQTLTELDTEGDAPHDAFAVALPSSLTSIEWFDLCRITDPAWQFPAGLTSLRLECWSALTGASAALRLPTGLKELVIPLHLRAHELQLPDCLSVLHLMEQCVEHMRWPAQLHTLVLSGYQTGALGKWTPPASLTSLELNEWWNESLSELRLPLLTRRCPLLL